MHKAVISAHMFTALRTHDQLTPEYKLLWYVYVVWGRGGGGGAAYHKYHVQHFDFHFQVYGHVLHDTLPIL